MSEVLTQDLMGGGPGTPPQPWTVVGGTVSYDGAVLVPSNVDGGYIAEGTINANNYYIKGILLDNPVNKYLLLAGGTLTGPLNISGPSAIIIPGGSAGQMLVTNGSGGLSWSSLPTGGPYLKLTGGTLSGTLTLANPGLFALGGGSAGQNLATDGAGHLYWMTPTGFAFFDAPSDSTTYARNNANWVHIKRTDISDLTSGAVANIGDAPPATPLNGNLWWDSVGAQLYISYNDGTSTQWVIANNTQGLIDAPTDGAFYGRSNALWAQGLPLTGGTLTGILTLAADPSNPLDAATKHYADTRIINPNKIINGDMRFNQRGNASGTATGYNVDRWQFAATLATKGTWSVATAGAGLWAFGFSYYLQFTSNSAYVPVAGDYFTFMQPIEADSITDTCWGTANAQPITITFICQASIAGMYSGCIRNSISATYRAYPFTFNIPSASTWTKITVTIPGDTVGPWTVNGNTAGMYLWFCFGGSGALLGPPGVWASANYVGATGTTNTVGTNGANFIITGVKLEVGPVATPYPVETLSKRQADCDRYFQTYSNLMNNIYGAAGAVVYASWALRTLMRATPVQTFFGINYGNSSALAMWTLNATLLGIDYTITAAGNAYCYFSVQLNAEI
jgi:hypothetical protein